MKYLVLLLSFNLFAADKPQSLSFKELISLDAQYKLIDGVLSGLSLDPAVLSAATEAYKFAIINEVKARANSLTNEVLGETKKQYEQDTQGYECITKYQGAIDEINLNFPESIIVPDGAKCEELIKLLEAYNNQG